MHGNQIVVTHCEAIACNVSLDLEIQCEPAAALPFFNPLHNNLANGAIWGIVPGRISSTGRSDCARPILDP
jgi:hypothetical protein